MFKKNIIFSIVGLLVFGGLVFAYLSIYHSDQPLVSQPQTQELQQIQDHQQTSSTIIEDEESMLNYTSAYTYGPTINITSIYQEDNILLNKVANYQAVKAKYGLRLTSNQEKFLDQNKFLLIDLGKTSYKSWENFDQMLADFDSIGGGEIYDRKPEDTKLITPDIVLHAYHKYFELTLEQLEQKELSQALGDFLVNLHSNLATAGKNSSGYLKERYQILEAQIVLARVLFENKSIKPDFFENPDQIDAYNKKDKTIDSVQNAKKILAKYSADLTPELVKNIQYDLDKIYAANGTGSSPLFRQYTNDLITDYTQFTPRSHYTKNSILRAYFRTMMYLGRSSYFLKSNLGIVDFGLLANQFTVRNSSGVMPLDSWNKIMTITGFYAGQSDDLTYTEWQNFVSEILGSQGSDNEIASAANVKKLAQNLNQLRYPKILSDIVVGEDIPFKTKADLLGDSLACRIFGQRFTFDGWVLNDLTAGDEKTEVRLPSTPSALFVSAAMGDLQAQKHVGDFLQKEANFTTDNVNGFLT